MSGFVKNVIHAGAGILTSRLFGMVRDMAVAAAFGATLNTDAFLAAFAVPNLFRAFFAEGALSSVFMPLMTDKMRAGGDRTVSSFLSSLLIASGSVMLLIVFSVFLFSGQAASVFMPGHVHDASAMAIASVMMRVMIPYLFFISLCGILSGFLNLKNVYYAPGASTAILNIVMIAGAFVGYLSDNIIYVCYGVLVGGIIQFAFLFFLSLRHGYTPFPFKGYDRDASRFFVSLVPSVIGVGISQINFMTGRIIASFLSIGSISYLYYANRLFQFPLGMFAVAVGTVTLTDISLANSSGRFDERNRLIDKAVNAVLLIMIPATAGLILLSDPIIALIYGHNMFSAADVSATAGDLRAYTSGLLYYSVISVFSRVFYSDRSTFVPVVGAVIAFFINIFLSTVLMGHYGHEGVAFASSAAALVNCVYLVFMMRNYRYAFSVYSGLLAKILIAVGVMSAAVFYADRAGVGVLVCVAAGCAVYAACLIVMRVDIKGVLR